MFFTFLLNSNYLLGFEGIENACNDYCGNWKVSKKNSFMLTARSISIECAIVPTKPMTENVDENNQNQNNWESSH